MGFSEVEPEKRQAVLAASCALLEKTAGLSSLATQAGYQVGISDDVFLRWDQEFTM